MRSLMPLPESTIAATNAAVVIGGGASAGAGTTSLMWPAISHE
jgi:hypothetical protein